MVTGTDEKKEIYDCIGIGFGPSNIALAIALEEHKLIENTRFLERAGAPDWQPDMLIEGTDIQHHPLRDLVTPRNPRSPYGFLSYLKDEERLFDYLNLSAPFPPRTEYARYVRWVARKFNDFVDYNADVVSVTPARFNGQSIYEVSCGNGAVYRTRSVSMAPGRSVFVPEIFENHLSDRIIHSRDYLSAVSRWSWEGGVHRVAIIGASQSALEILLDLPAKLPKSQCVGITRSLGFKQKDLSPFTETVYEPDFVDMFYDASETTRKNVLSELWRSNYGAADHDIIDQLNFRLYEQKVTGRKTIQLLCNSEIVSVADADGKVTLESKDRYSGETRFETFDAVVCATGYKNTGTQVNQETFHPLLNALRSELNLSESGCVQVRRDFSCVMTDALADWQPVYLNGLCETSHGFGDAGSFSLLSLRSEKISHSILKWTSQSPPIPKQKKPIVTRTPKKVPVE